LFGEIMACDGFFLDLLEMLDPIFSSRDGGVWKGVRDSTGFISHHEEEWRGIAGVMLSMVMDEFCHGEVLHPVSWGSTAVDTKIGF